MSGTMTSQDRFDVVIVGFGPTGATLANLLGQQGVSTLVLDREAEAYHLPRAVHFDDEVMRVFQTVGIADQLAQHCHVNPGMKFVAADGRLLLDWPRPQELTRQGWHASYRFHQPELEKLLRNAINRYPCVETRTLCNVNGIEIGQDGSACVTYLDERDGETQSVTSRYVVGCDGANSLVRDVIGSGMDDFGFEERWLVIDAILKRPMSELGDHSVQFCDPVRPATYVRGTGSRRRWEISVLEHEDSNEIIRSEAVWERLSKWITPDDAELERQAVYTFRSCVAKKWRKGPLLIAGDAAHLTPPFMGQGMCAGIRDVSNLAWKLANCVGGRARDSLLDTYQSERVPHAQSYIETAVRLGRLINQADTEAALRAALKAPDGTARMSSIAPSLGSGLQAGNDQHRGVLGWQINQKNGSRFDDEVGQRFALIAKDDLACSMNATTSLMTIKTDQNPEANEYLAELDVSAVILRPDRYILGTADTDEELAGMLSVVQAIA